jgi:GntR family transcriptional regulator
MEQPSAEIADRPKIAAGTKAVLRFCHRYVDDVPWSTQATYSGSAYPVHHHDVPGRLEPDELRDRRPVRPE